MILLKHIQTYMAVILPTTILKFASAMLMLHFSTFTKIDLHVIHNYVTPAEAVLNITTANQTQFKQIYYF